MKQRYLIPGILALAAAAWLYMAIAVYGIWDEGPLGGFMPLIASLVTLGFSLASIIRGGGGDKRWHLTVFISVVLIVALILLIPFIGMLPAMLLMLIGWFRCLEKYPWRFSLITSACVILCVWLIFALWLKVPFPDGWVMEQLV